MKRAVILGVNGQDGSYLAEILLEQGYHILGIGRQSVSRYVEENKFYQYQSLDIKQTSLLLESLKLFKPTKIFHLAAVHGAAGFQYESVFNDVIDVNLKSLHVLLEYARNEDPEVRIAYASSAKVFGNKLSGTIAISNPHYSDCLYSIAKNAAGKLINYYHNKYQIYGSIAYFFNHDSPRREKEYFIPTIIRILANVLKTNNYSDEIQTLDFYCDWGSAAEYMEMFGKLLTLSEPKEVIIASGKTWHGREFVKQLFEHHGIDFEQHIKERNHNLSPELFTADINETSSILGITPSRDIFSISNEILQSLMKTDHS